MAFIVVSAVCDIKTGHILAYENTDTSNPEYAIDVGFFDNFKKVEKFVKTELKNWQDSDFNNHRTSNLQFRFDVVDCVLTWPGRQCRLAGTWRRAIGKTLLAGKHRCKQAGGR